MLIAGYTGMVDLYSPLLKSNIGSTLCVVANVSGRSPIAGPSLYKGKRYLDSIYHMDTAHHRSKSYKRCYNMLQSFTAVRSRDMVTACSTTDSHLRVRILKVFSSDTLSGSVET
jgi:hypothetical protein